jgi:molybdate transport system regulatory protein
MARERAQRPVVQFRLRIRKGEHVAIGPGKIALLEAIAETGSITAAARRLSMSYRRAWLLVDEMNQCMREPVVDTETGGARGGGSRLTATGTAIVEQYRAIERRAETATAQEIDRLLQNLA